MNDLEHRLKLHREDYERCVGVPFKYFFCPILQCDEPAELCLGHIVNQCFSSVPRTTVVQRKDIDNFFGAQCESDFAAFIHSETRELDEIWVDRNLFAKCRPKLIIEGDQVPYYPATSGQSPNDTSIRIVASNGQYLDIAARVPAERLEHASEQDMQVVIDSDTTIAAVGTLLKTAHLILFELLGYAYIHTPCGQFVGRILRDCFLKNRDDNGKRVKIGIAVCLERFRNSVFGLSDGQERAPTDSLRSRTLGLCSNESSVAVAIIVTVQIGASRHCVLLPDLAMAGADFYDAFLKDPSDVLRVHNVFLPASINGIQPQWQETGESWHLKLIRET